VNYALPLLLLGGAIGVGSGVRAAEVVDDSLARGAALMQQVEQAQQQYPYIYTEQTMILTDAAGHRDVRQLRHYYRVDTAGHSRSLLIFDAPKAVRGTALLAIDGVGMGQYIGLYLPALRRITRLNRDHSRSSYFLGSDFSADDLLPERVGDYRYRRQPDMRIGSRLYAVVDARPKSLAVEQATGNSRRRLFVHLTGHYIVRIDFFDRHGLLYKRETRHDFHRFNSTMWRSNMLYMRNFREQHATLIKVQRRIFSRDYVPAEMFTPAWLGEHLRFGHVEPVHQSADSASEPSAQVAAGGS